MSGLQRGDPPPAPPVWDKTDEVALSAIQQGFDIKPWQIQLMRHAFDERDRTR